MHSSCYISTCHTMTEDYRRCPRTTTTPSGDSPSTNDKDSEGCFPGSSDSIQVCETFLQDGSGRFFCVTGVRDNTRSREPGRHQVLKTYFQKLSKRAISPHQATPGSVGYDLFTPIDFIIQTKEQKTVFIDLAITPPEGY